MLDLDPTMIFFSIVFGIVGMGYWSYGKKQNQNFLIAGIVLMVYPYFVNTLWLLISIGLAVTAAPFLLTAKK